LLFTPPSTTLAGMKTAAIDKNFPTAPKQHVVTLRKKKKMRAVKLGEEYKRLRAGSNLNHTAALIRAAMKIGVTKRTAKRYDSEMGYGKLFSSP
jgi:hypothetical protein